MALLEVSERLDRLPPSRFHYRMLTIFGISWAVDGFDTGIIAFIMAALAKDWHLPAGEIGLVLSVGLFGTFLGSLAASSGDRFGRKVQLQWAVGLFSLFSLLVAFAWNVPSLIITRTLVGLGTGAAIPLLSPYLMEFLPRNFRGRIQGLLNSFWGIGWIATSAIAYFLIPHFGWRIAAGLGFLPIVLVWVIRRWVPESPRWLAQVGRTEEADRVVQNIEREVGVPRSEGVAVEHSSVSTPRVGWSILFKGGYGKRTVMLWLVWFFYLFSYYGLFAWLPTLLVKAGYTLSQSFLYVVIMQIAYIPNQLASAWFIDRWGRKPVVIGNAVLAAIFGTIYAYEIVNHGAPALLILLSILVSFAVSGFAGSNTVYTPEQYPTAIRATGYGLASAVGRVGSFIAPLLMGMLLSVLGVGGAILLVTLPFLLVAATIGLLGGETRGSDPDRSLVEGLTHTKVE